MTAAETLNDHEVLPLVPLRDVVVFPYMILPLFIGRDKSLAAVNAALAGNRLLFVATQKEMMDSPDISEIHMVGTVVQVMRSFNLPDGRLKIMVQGVHKGKIIDFAAKEPYFQVRIEPLSELETAAVGVEEEALVQLVKNRVN